MSKKVTLKELTLQNFKGLGRKVRRSNDYCRSKRNR